jgi:hydroxymethylpyrimidine pyrophosphatase-like HAD family hydrolase
VTVSADHDVGALAPRLDAAVARGDWLDAFLFAAAMHQVAEDALDAEPALLLHAGRRLADADGRVGRGLAAAAGAGARGAGAVAARRRPPALGRWTCALGELVALLAGRVHAGTPADERLRAALGAVRDGLERIPDAVRHQVARQPACFRAFDQHPEDMRALAARFAAVRPARGRPLLVVGVRTSGSYLAPLAAAALRATGYAEVRVVTLRPGRRLRADQRAVVRPICARGGLALVCDDPPASGRAVGDVARDLARRRLEVMLLLAVFGDGALPRGLREFPSVVLPQSEWAVTARLEPAATRAAVARLVGPGAEVVSCDPLPDAAHGTVRGHARRAYRVGLRTTATGAIGSTTIAVEGVGIGHLGAHAVAVHDALEPFLPAVLGLDDGLLYREWLPAERRADRAGPDERERFAALLAGYVDARARALPLRADRTLRARGERPAWEIAGLILGAAFGPAEPAARVLLVDPAVKRILRVARPAETDGRMELSRWFRADAGRLVKVDWAEPADASSRVASCDPVCDLAQVTTRTQDRALAHRLRIAYAALAGAPVDPERWLLYELAHLWTARRDAGDPRAADAAREACARAMRAYLHEIFFADLRPAAGGPLCGLDIDGVLEQDVLGFSALTPAAAAALRALIAHGHRPVLVSGRGAAEVAERCAAYRLPGGVAEYGAVVHIAGDGAATSLLTDAEAATLDRIRDALDGRDGVRVDAAFRHVVRAHVLDARGRRRPPPDAAVAAAVRAAHASGVRPVRGDAQTDLVVARIDKGLGARALAARLDGDAGAGPPLRLAVGDAAPDAPLLALAARPFVPAHAADALRGAGQVTRRPYQAGFAQAVGEVIGHAPGTCAACRVPDGGESRRLLLALLALREGGLRGLPRQALRVALAR